MKKLLSLLGAVGLVASGSSVVVSCGSSDKDAIDISAGLVSDSINKTGVALVKDTKDSSNFTGNIANGATSITLDFSKLTDDQKAKAITMDADGTKVLDKSDAKDASTKVKVTGKVTAYDKDKKVEPSIAVTVSGDQKSLTTGNVVILAFTFDGMKESTVTLTVNDAGTGDKSLSPEKIKTIKIGDTALSSTEKDKGTYTVATAAAANLDISKVDFTSPVVKLGDTELKPTASGAKTYALTAAQITDGATITIASGNYDTLTITIKIGAASNKLAKAEIAKLTSPMGTITSDADGVGTLTLNATAGTVYTIDASKLTTDFTNGKASGEKTKDAAEASKVFTLATEDFVATKTIKIRSDNYDDVTINIVAAK